MKSPQQDFYSFKALKDYKPRKEHGGGLRSGKRKLERPFSPNKALHITLRSKRAKGKWSFLKSKNRNRIDKLVYVYAKKFNIQVFEYANVGNHLHLLLRAKSKKSLQRFFKTLAGMIPRVITQARKGSPIGKFWDELIYSKLVSWGRQFKSTANYIVRNTLEAFGVIPPRDKARGHISIQFQELFDG